MTNRWDKNNAMTQSDFGEKLRVSRAKRVKMQVACDQAFFLRSGDIRGHKSEC